MGEIVITFLNETTPFIRLATGDLSYIPKGFNDRIAGIFGRADNSIKIKGVFVHFWQLDELSNKLNTKLKLIADTDENGLDFLKIYMSKNVDIKTEFKKTFGLKLSIAEIDDKIEKTEIIDNRKRLQEK
jgi:phenylacetate-CoA ligase